MDVSPDAFGDNQKPWARLGPISVGGTVLGLAISPVRRVLGVLVSPTPHIPLYWAATSCGTFRSYTSGVRWQQYLGGLTTPLLSAMAVAVNGYLFAGAVDGSLFFSNDFGLTWEPGEVPEESRAPVVAVAASPNFRKDRTAFAATAGAGVLVTHDAGQSWQNSSAGLADSAVLALAVSPDWSHREAVFAATGEGVYASLDGGRAWHKTGLVTDDDLVSALVISPAANGDRAVYAGTEGGRVYRSATNGHSWELLSARVGDGAVSALWLAMDFAESGRIVCGCGADIHISSDRGKSWRLAAELPDAILVLTGDERSVLAGLCNAGVWESRDGGLSWKSATGDLAARGFAWLKVAGDRLYAIGPQEGIWVSENGGKEWENLSGLTPYLPLTAACTTRDALLVAGHGGEIVRSVDGGRTWEMAGNARGVQALLLLPETGDGWAGTAEGRLLTTHDNGATWQMVGMPCQGQEILSIAASPRYRDDHSLLMGTAALASPIGEAGVAVWRSTDRGSTWRHVTAQATSARWADIVIPSDASGNPLERAALATGPYVLCSSPEIEGGWTSTIVDPSGASVLSVVDTGETDHGRQLLAATGTGVFRSADGGRTWIPFMEGLSPQIFLGLAMVSRERRQALYALSLGGVIWKRDL